MLLLLALVSAFGLFDHSLWSGNDAREGAMIAEMARDHVWVTPVFNGEHYLEKPPLLHWTGVLLCKIFCRFDARPGEASGGIREGLVRLPAALYAFGSLLVLLSWARALNREAAGFAAAFMCATSALFLEYSRIVLTDSALTFMVVFSLWLFWRAYTAENFFAARYLLFLFVSAFSFYAKGLIGPGMVWLSVAVWLAYQRRWRLLCALVPLFGVVFLLVLAPWVFALWKAGGSDFIYRVFWENQFGRFLSFDDKTLPLDPYLIHKEPIYFYLLNLPVRLLPWTLLVVPALFCWFRISKNTFREPLALFLKTSLLAIAGVLHVSSAKAACYALPLFPLIFLMTGVWLEDAVTSGAASPWQKKLIVATLMLVCAAIMAAPAAYIAAFIFHLKALWAPGSFAAVAGFLLALSALSIGYASGKRLRFEFKNGRQLPAVLHMPAVLAAVGLLAGAAFIPAVDFHRTYLPFAEMALRQMKSAKNIAYAGDSERDLGAFMFYLNSRLRVVSITNDCNAITDFASSARESLGLIVPVDKMGIALRQARSLPFRLKEAENAGKKSDSFRLMIFNEHH